MIKYELLLLFVFCFVLHISFGKLLALENSRHYNAMLVKYAAHSSYISNPGISLYVEPDSSYLSYYYLGYIYIVSTVS